MSAPEISQDPMYQMLRNDDVEGFNQAREQGQTCELKGCDLRGLDLRNVNLSGMDLQDAYFRGTDLRGVDLRDCNMDGVSLADAKVSGCYFPVGIPATEIHLSITMGIRIRHIEP